MKKNFNYLLIFTLLLQINICVSSCANTDGGTQNGTLINEDDCKEELEKVDGELTDEFKASDFENILELTEYMLKECEEYDMEEESEEVLDECIDVLHKGKESSGSNGYYDIYEVIYRLSNLKGKFVANDETHCIEKTNANNFSLYIKDQNNNPCDVTITTTGKTKTIHCYDDYYNYTSGYDENDNYYWNETIDEIYIEVPEKVTVVLKQNSKKLLEVVINTDLSSMASSEFNLAKDKYNVSTTISFNGYTLDIENLRYENKKESKASINFKHGNKILLAANASCIPDVKYEYCDDCEEEHFDECNITNSFATINILDKIRIEGTCNNFQNLDNAMWNNEYDGDVEKREEMVNKCFDANVFFNGAAQAYAKIELECGEEYYEWEDGYNYDQYFTPVIVFNDNSRNSLEDFFNENNFNKTINAFEKLFEEFENMFYSYDLDF